MNDLLKQAALAASCDENDEEQQEFCKRHKAPHPAVGCMRCNAERVARIKAAEGGQRVSVLERDVTVTRKGF